MAFKDLSGQIFGHIKVIDRNYEYQKARGRREAYWNCICDCGKELIKSGYELKNLKTQSCGKCYQRTEIGKKYGKLTIIEFAGQDDIPYVHTSYFKCQCDCGNIITLRYNRLTSGHTLSCGCAKQSLGEQLVEEVLQELNLRYKKEYSFKDLKDKDYLRFDFAILDDYDNIISLIEFDGPQHINGKFNLDENFDFKLLQKHDLMKDSYAKKHNIKLIRIPYKDKNKEKIKKYIITI